MVAMRSLVVADTRDKRLSPTNKNSRLAPNPNYHDYDDDDNDGTVAPA